MSQFDVSKFTARDWALVDLEIAIREKQEAAVDHAAYRKRPVDWLVEQLQIPRAHIEWSVLEAYDGHPWDGTPDPFVVMANALANYDTNGVRGVACESGTTTGKTVWLAWIILWFLACHEGAIVVTVAPKEDQLRFHVWKQLTVFWPRFQELFPAAKKDTLKIQMVPGSDAWGAIGFVAGVAAHEVAGTADKAKGFHAPHMLIVYEEMTGVHQAIREAFKRTCRAPHNLQVGVGNPVHQYDGLHRFAVAPGTLAVRISCLDHPNIVTGNDAYIEGAVSGIGLAQALRDVKGNEKDPEYLASVRGISPSEAKESLIKRAHLERAVKLGEAWQERYADARWPQAMGGDPANSTSGDPAGWCRYVGPVVVEVHADQCPDANQFGARLWRIAEAYKIPPEHIGIDPIGVGAGTVNEIRRLLRHHEDAAMRYRHLPRLESGGKPVQRVAKPGEGAGWITDANRFANLRAQMIWQFAQDLADEKIGLPNDEELFEELLTFTYEVRSNKVYILEKEKIRELLKRSPNKADCVVYGNWVRARTTPIDREELVGREDRDAGTVKTKAGKVTLKRRWEDQDTGHIPAALTESPRGVKKWW